MSDRNMPTPSSGAKAPGPPAALPPMGRRVVDWTQGSIPLNLLKLSWPMVVGNTLNMLGPLVDVIWVGKLGAEASAAQAGVGVSSIIVQMMMSAMMGLAMGARALVARFIGAGDEKGANQVAAQALVAGAFFATIMGVVGFFLAESILKLLGLDREVVREGAIYLRIVFLSGIVMSTRFMAEGAMQSAGDTLRPMIQTAIYRAVHVVLCPFLVLGLWIFPRMGVAGAAWTNLIAQSLGVVLALWVLLTGRTRLRLTFKGFRIDPRIMRRIARIGLPSSIMGVQMALGAFILIKLLSPFGTTAVTAHTIWQRVDMVMFMPVMGLAMSAGVLAGQNLGAGRPERAVKSGWTAAFIAQGFMLVCVVALLIWAEWVVRVFNSDPALVKLGAQFLRISAVGYLVFAFNGVFQFCISGSGDTFPPMVIALAGTWLIQLPLAFFLSREGTGMGLYGIRWAMVITAFLGTIAFTIYFMKGRWRHKRV